jgi:hypothetical protein
MITAMKSKIKVEKKVGKIFEINERKFYSIVEISTIESDNYFSESITPLAFFVSEPLKKYILPLSEDEIDKDEIIRLVFPDDGTEN